jgi:hypothetical protein
MTWISGAATLHAIQNGRFGTETFKRWYEPACKNMLSGGRTFQIQFDRELKPGLTVESIEQWATEPH